MATRVLYPCKSNPTFDEQIQEILIISTFWTTDFRLGLWVLVLIGVASWWMELKVQN